MKFDLHVHTNHSDGRLTPIQVVDIAVEKGLSGIAITDHDTTTGIDEAIKQSYKHEKFKIIPGIELSCIYKDEEVHILGYFIDYKSPSIIKVTNDLKKARIKRGSEIISKLNHLGLKISIEEVKFFSGEDYIGRPHIARALISKGYIYTIQEAFDRFLNRGRPAYIERYSLSIEESIDIIRTNGGISVLAHPGLLKNKDIIKDCISLGTDGLECIHSKHNKSDIALFHKIAERNDLIVTGGSDCHGDTTNGPLLLGKYFINITDISKFKEMI